jgi:hypothetical protein
MPINDYIPHTDHGFRAWAVNFAEHMSSNFAAYMLTSAQAATIQAAVDEFVEKYEITLNPDLKTKTTVIAKDNARSIAEGMCRDFAILIKDNLGIDDEDKVAAGVRPINPDRDPINVPMTSPLLNILGNTPGGQTLRFADPTTPESRAKPFGAGSLQLFLAVTDGDEEAPLSEARFHSMVTKNPISVDFTQEQDGKMATYYARWASVKGEFGPWSLPIALRIAA